MCEFLFYYLTIPIGGLNVQKNLLRFSHTFLVLLYVHVHMHLCVSVYVHAGRKSSSSHGGYRTRKTDTNILAVKFDSLAEQGNLHTGDAQFCSNPSCSSIISHLSKLQGEEHDMEKVCGSMALQLMLSYVPGIQNSAMLFA